MDERNKIVKKKSIITTVIVVVCLGIVWLLVLAPFFPWNKELNNPIGVIIGLGCFWSIVVGILTYFLSKLLFMDLAKTKESINTVETELPIEKMVQVIPRKGKHTKFICDLTDIAKFYAYRENEKSKIKIFIKFNNEDFERLYEEIPKEYFAYDYNITE